MMRNVSLFFVSTEMEEFRGESFFFLFPNSLCCDLYKKPTHNNRDGGHYLMVFLPPCTSPFLLSSFIAKEFLPVNLRKEEGTEKGEERSSDILNEEQGWIGDMS